jgi:hypothetical protein
MLDAVMALILPIVVLFLLAAAFLVMMALPLRGAFIAAGISYFIIGLFIAAAQFGGTGICPSWRSDGAWWPIVDWPGDIYLNVFAGDLSFRRYLIPKTCEGLAGQPLAG